MADWIFDGPNLRFIEPDGVGDTTYEVARDLYSAWKRWVALDIGSYFPPAFQVEGGTPVGNTGIFTGSTFIVVNGWKGRLSERSHQATLNGNLFSDDGVLFVPTLGPFTAAPIVNQTAAAQGIQSGSGLSAQQAADLTFIRDVAESDENLTETRAQKLHKDTQEVLVDKDVSGGAAVNIQLTERA